MTILSEERPGLVALLARRFRDLQLAEDAVQEAFASAMDRWSRDGLPDRPGAWLTTAAQRKAIDMLRKQRPTDQLTAGMAVVLPERPVPEIDVHDPRRDDDVFALLLTCCHPSLPPETRVALTLRHVCGLTDQQIAAALLMTQAALTKRLVRARRKIRDAGITFEPPSGPALADRLDDARTVIYALFTEGHLATTGAVDVDVCAEAVWLARQLQRIAGDDETTGLLALLLVQHARRDARVRHGLLVPLEQQARARWDHAEIAEARLVLEGTTGRHLGPYQVEAAIALLHVAVGGPDWPRIADLHGVLARLAPSPIAGLNRAYAVAMSDGPRAGMAILEPVLASGRLDGVPDPHVVEAELARMQGDLARAARAVAAAMAVTDSQQQRAGIERRALAFGIAVESDVLQQRSGTSEG